MPFHFCISTTTQLASSSFWVLVEDQALYPPQTPFYTLSSCYHSVLLLISSSGLAFFCFIPIVFNSGWLWADTLRSWSLFSKRRLWKNRDCNCPFSWPGGEGCKSKRKILWLSFWSEPSQMKQCSSQAVGAVLIWPDSWVMTHWDRVGDREFFFQPVLKKGPRLICIHAVHSSNTTFLIPTRRMPGRLPLSQTSLKLLIFWLTPPLCPPFLGFTGCLF